MNTCGWRAITNSVTRAAYPRRRRSLTSSESPPRSALLEQPGVAVGRARCDTRIRSHRVQQRLDLRAAGEHPRTPSASKRHRPARTTRTRAQSSYDPEIAAAFGRAHDRTIWSTWSSREVVHLCPACRDRRQVVSIRSRTRPAASTDNTTTTAAITRRSVRASTCATTSTIDCALYASVGRFTQAQHVEEWRVEEAQAARRFRAGVHPHASSASTYEPAARTRWGFEAYTKRWTTVAPYFDNQLDPLSLSPELTPDRIRVDPHESEAPGSRSACARNSPTS